MGKVKQLLMAQTMDDMGSVEEYLHAPGDDAPDSYNQGWKDGYDAAMTELYRSKMAPEGECSAGE